MVEVFAFLSAAAAATLAKAPEVTVGWSPTTTMSAITNVILALLGGGGLKILANYLLDMRKIAEARAGAVDARGDAQNQALTARVSQLEAELSNERRECDRQLAEMRGEIRDMQKQMDGMVRQFLAFQDSEARALPLTPQMTKAMDSLKAVRGTGDE